LTAENLVSSIKSVRDLILDTRFSAVNELLKTTKYGLDQIALKTGFSSANLLSHEYKARFGIPPSRSRWLVASG